MLFCQNANRWSIEPHVCKSECSIQLSIDHCQIYQSKPGSTKKVMRVPLIGQGHSHKLSPGKTTYSELISMTAYPLRTFPSSDYQL
jgi:hypothetical protein